MNEALGPGPSVEADLPSSKLAEISRAMVALYKDQLGRGPTRVRSDFAGTDTLICAPCRTPSPPLSIASQRSVSTSACATVAFTSNTPARCSSAPRRADPRPQGACLHQRHRYPPRCLGRDLLP